MSDDFFGDLGKSITKVSQRMADRTGKAIASTKINAVLNTEEKALDEAFYLAGTGIYAQYQNGVYTPDEKMAKVLETITEQREKIAQLRKELAEARGMRVCSQCGELIEMDVRFCPYCGAEAEPEKETETE